MTQNDSSKRSKTNIDKIVETFFNTFSSINGITNLQTLREISIPEMVIIKQENESTEIYNLDQFLTPREKLLNSGRLQNFSEQEIQEHTDIVGSIAQRKTVYEKSWLENGEVIKIRGYKFFQFIKTAGQWKITSLIWEDETLHKQ